MSSRDVFGRLLAAPTIERGVEVTLRYYLGQYLGEVLEQNGYARDALADPADLERVVDLNDYASSAQIALVVVATRGTTGDATSSGLAYTATWEVIAGAVCDLGDRLDTREAAELYCAAAGGAVSHQGVAQAIRNPDAGSVPAWIGVRDADGYLASLEGSSVVWRGERYRPVDRNRPGLIAGEAIFHVTVEDARSLWAPELEPPPDPTFPSDRGPAVPGEPAPVIPTVTVEPIPPTEDLT